MQITGKTKTGYDIEIAISVPFHRLLYVPREIIPNIFDYIF